jgi:hypothetical protein
VSWLRPAGFLKQFWEEKMSDDPISRLRFARQEIDAVFGPGYAQQHPEVVTTVVLTAA